VFDIIQNVSNKTPWLAGHNDLWILPTKISR